MNSERCKACSRLTGYTPYCIQCSHLRITLEEQAEKNYKIRLNEIIANLCGEIPLPTPIISGVLQAGSGDLNIIKIGSPLEPVSDREWQRSVFAIKQESQEPLTSDRLLAIQEHIKAIEKWVPFSTFPIRRETVASNVRDKLYGDEESSEFFSFQELGFNDFEREAIFCHIGFDWRVMYVFDDGIVAERYWGDPLCYRYNCKNVASSVRDGTSQSSYFISKLFKKIFIDDH